MKTETRYSIRELRKDFPDDTACLNFIFDDLHSRKCSCGGSYSLIKGRKQFQCSKCRAQIAPCIGTIFEKSPTPLTLWFHALYVFSNAKSGISAKEMQRHLGVTYKCAWRILDQIRKALPKDERPLKGDVEIDTGFFGGRGYAGKNNEQLSRVMANKSKVIIAVERGGRIKAEVVPNAGSAAMGDFLKRNVETKLTSLITDASNTYTLVAKPYSRFSVNHKHGFVVDGDVHINTIETFFSHLKRSIKGTFKAVSREHLQTYLDAFVFHYNNRYSDKSRFSVLLGGVLHASK